MKQIQSNHLNLITGGAAVAAWSPANGDHFAGAVMRPAISYKQPTNTAVNMDESDASASNYCCNHVFSAPKNGDRNAQGQQYSSGTWWDDMN